MHRRPLHLASLVIALATVASCVRDYSVAVSDGTVSVARAFWRPIENPEPFAENFEARAKRVNEEFAQVLTVFKAPMREDQRGDAPLPGAAWVDAMIVHPPGVTIQVRVAHRGHWILSRQTFASRPGVDPTALGPFLEPEQIRLLVGIYSDEISRTRSTLEAMTAF